MSDNISVFQGAKNPVPLQTTDWQSALTNIQSDKYKEPVLQAQKNPEQYRNKKLKLPAVTFGGTFQERRAKDNIDTPTGFIIPDIDHISDVESVINLLKQDENIWFAFRSPSGKGIKCGIRARGIETDEDIKKLYDAVELYFKQVYKIKIDPACKDISRLTFMSYDPDLFVNSEPYYFNISKWEKNGRPEYILPENREGNWKEKYGKKVLESACDEIKKSEPGNQHAIRLKKSYLIGGFIGEFINEVDAVGQLEEAVKESGAERLSEAMKTVRDGIEMGKKHPITVRENYKKQPEDYYFDITEAEELSQQTQQTKQTKQTQQTDKHSAKLSNAKQNSAELSKTKQDFTENSGSIVSHAPKNLAAHIREWITNSTGSFTTEQLDREFCLTTRKEKNARSNALTVYIKNKLVRRDKRIKGKYHILDSKIDFLDLDGINETPFPIKFPFNLHAYVKIPRKAIVVIAGSSNAGKTALMLNTLNLNIQQQYEKLYLFSEMGGGELKSRITAFDTPLSEWKENVKMAEKTYDFDGAIQHYNQDGLTCIDYLEEVEGEYFKIASSIRDIYDAVNDGVALINIQKKKSGEFARGGEATAEKARLYLTLDFMGTVENDIICALKVVKVKEWRNRNLLNHEIHFKLHKGCLITELNEWTPSHKIDREKCMAEYESSRREPLGDDDFIFQTAEGQRVVIREDHAQKWCETFQNIDVFQELARISEDSFKKPFIKFSGYFFQLSGILKKKNEKHS